MKAFIPLLILFMLFINSYKDEPTAPQNNGTQPEALAEKTIGPKEPIPHFEGNQYLAGKVFQSSPLTFEQNQDKWMSKSNLFRSHEVTIFFCCKTKR